MLFMMRRRKLLKGGGRYLIIKKGEERDGGKGMLPTSVEKTATREEKHNLPHALGRKGKRRERVSTAQPGSRQLSLEQEEDNNNNNNNGDGDDVKDTTDIN